MSTRAELVVPARRIVVKVGSSSLTTASGGLDADRLGALVATLAAWRIAGREVVLVSSGAIAAGLAPLGLSRRPNDLATAQAAASVGQGLLVHRYTEDFAAHGLTVGQVLLTVDDVTRRGHYRNAYRTLARLLELGTVPIVNENDTVATDEIRFGDNDRLAALVAHLVHADLLVLLSDVDALYDGPPSRAGTERIPLVRNLAELDSVEIGMAGAAGVGTGGMQTKVQAASIATAASIPVLLTDARNAHSALDPDVDQGTLFLPTGRRRPTRLLWLAHATAAVGEISVDAGAVRALTEHNASLLAAGIVGVTGDFVAGDPVDIRGPGGRFARGLVSYDAEEIVPMMGKSSPELVAELGADYQREVVPRDDLIVLS